MEKVHCGEDKLKSCRDPGNYESLRYILIGGNWSTAYEVPSDTLLHEHAMIERLEVVEKVTGKGIGGLEMPVKNAVKIVCKADLIRLTKEGDRLFRRSLLLVMLMVLSDCAGELVFPPP